MAKSAATSTTKKPSPEALTLGKAALPGGVMPFTITAENQACAGQSFIDDLGIDEARRLATNPPNKFATLTPATRKATIDAFNACLPGDAVGPAIVDRWSKKRGVPPVAGELRDCVIDNAEGAAGEIAAGLQSKDVEENDQVILDLYEGCDVTGVLHAMLVYALTSHDAATEVAECIVDEVQGDFSFEEMATDAPVGDARIERVRAASRACKSNASAPSTTGSG